MSLYADGFDPNGKTIIDNRIYQSGMSFDAIGTYFLMLPYDEGHRFTEEELAVRGNARIEAARLYLNELYEHGYIRKHKIEDNYGNLIRYEWSVYKKPDGIDRIDIRRDRQLLRRLEWMYNH